MQKARRHPYIAVGLRPLVGVRFQEYLALPDGAGRFTQDFSGPALLRIPIVLVHFYLQGFHLLSLTFPGPTTPMKHASSMFQFSGLALSRLPEAYRSLPRLSSPLTAKASTVCASSLDHITPSNLPDPLPVKVTFRILISKLYGCSGGAKRDRTVDLLRARQALSQLSYGPIYMP
eukprot:gene37886-49649_t